jgi:hypothetical protein
MMDRKLKTYPEAARVIALYLDEFCDENKDYINMIADASRLANKEIERLRNLLPDGGGKCDWRRSFDGHFNISCANETNQRGNGQFLPDEKIKTTKWNFKHCPYCGKEIRA